MSIEVTLGGNGVMSGVSAEIADYSVNEEATPVDASDSSGATGQITFTAVDESARLGSLLLLANTADLDDTERGQAFGDITSLTSTNGLVTVTADSVLGRLVNNVNMPAFVGTFEDLILAYFAAGGITVPEYTVDVDATLVSLPVAAPNWIDSDLWTKIKEVCVVFGAEVAMVGSTVFVRPLRTNTISPSGDSNVSWTAAKASTQSRRVEVAYYNTESKNNYTVVPDGGVWTQEEQVLTVDAGETLTVNVPVNMSVTAVENPIVLDFVGRNYVGVSAYCVSGADGFPIVPAQWTDGGGKVSVAIGEDGKSLDVTLTGAVGSLATYAPYRIAATALDGNFYSSLRLRASGVYHRAESIFALTGAEDTVTTDVGVTVNNIFVKNSQEAWKLAAAVAGRFSGPLVTVSRTVSAVTNTFGNIAGARFKWRRGYYRVRSASSTPVSVDYTAERDTTFADFNSEMSGKTFSNFTTTYAGMTFGEFSLAPLPNPDNDNDRY